MLTGSNLSSGKKLTEDAITRQLLKCSTEVAKNSSQEGVGGVTRCSAPPLGPELEAAILMRTAAFPQRTLLVCLLQLSNEQSGRPRMLQRKVWALASTF